LAYTGVTSWQEVATAIMKCGHHSREVFTWSPSVALRTATQAPKQVHTVCKLCRRFTWYLITAADKDLIRLTSMLAALGSNLEEATYYLIWLT